MRTIPNARTWHPDGWKDGTRLDVGAQGRIVRDSYGGTTQQRVLPGIANLHSHAFQRAMAGMAERQTHPADSFWTWRETMYRFAARFTPESLHAVAAQLYTEMLAAGYTTVCEFHYLHHAPDGRPYANPAAMSQALIQAARDTGIRLTLLPVLYMHGGFDGRPLSERQKRFGFDIDDFLSLLVGLRKLEGDTLRVGLAFHSLRAVPEAAMREVLEVEALDRPRPIHIHVAEQDREVADCLAWSGQRPVAWLLDHAPVGPRWCLVHATHMTPEETRALAASGAVAGLCPTTEANLGDGLFPLAAYLEAGGRVGIGSDSHVSVSPIAELRWLEYGQRLVTRRRNVAASASERSTGARLYRAAVTGGAQAMGRAVGAIAPGMRADLVVLDDEHPQLCGRSGDLVLDALVFSGNDNPVRDVMIGGAWVVRERAHHAHRAGERVRARFRRTIERLLG